MLQKLSDIAKNRFTATATAGLATVALLTPGVFNQQAHADSATTTSIPAYNQTIEERNSMSSEASKFGYEDRNNIGMVLYYGSGNKGTPDQFGDYLAGKIEKRAKERGLDFDAQHFVVLNTDGKAGMNVEFSMGPLGIDNTDYMVALSDIDRIIDKRVEANKVLQRLDSNRTIAAVTSQHLD